MNVVVVVVVGMVVVLWCGVVGLFTFGRLVRCSRMRGLSHRGVCCGRRVFVGVCVRERERGVGCGI